MAVAEDTDVVETPKKSKMPMILGLVLALAGGGGGFFAMYSGMIGGSGETAESEHVAEDMPGELPDVGFVELPQLIVPIGGAAEPKLLRFRAHLEVPSTFKEEVESINPRIVDVLNSYLRAVNIQDVSGRDSLPKLRAQMLRRVQIVTGKGRVRDLLIMELVVN